MTYPVYMVRVISRAIITKTDAGMGIPEELTMVYPEEDRAAILAEVYRQRPDLQPAQ